MKTIVFIRYSILVIFLTSYQAYAIAKEVIVSGPLEYFEQTLLLEEEQIDFTKLVLQIEQQTYPFIDLDVAFSRIETIVAKLKRMPEFGESSLERMGAILRYTYTPSDWNDMKPYKYDLSDPYGQRQPVSTLNHLLEFKYGNCVSMPTLIAVLGMELGVDVKLAVAPGHVFAIYKDESGNLNNIEATSGTLPKKSKYIEWLDIHPDAIKSGIYLKPLNKKASISIFLVELGRKYMRNGMYSEAHFAADLALKHHPKLVRAMLLKGTIYYQELQDELGLIRASGRLITIKDRERLDPINANNLYWFEKAEELGWREPKPNFEDNYLNNIRKLRDKTTDPR